ncbi:molybdopterin molybdotransferase MoeA [Cypionkella sp.]|uniref:molybdopterin molybdotransferase MoeA n=1 Tax=Cypionkella sp. TaxID=2811411 RepID=UPI002721A55A|nr:molybdopterin molybdotransferase MoeA [Cypionkella sp.]MDO8983827.1 molybdopterin molybdotransferase MoeA [Cypionkella sp.]MDP2051615.1 molybdopterin molybdotransferase MoeA [Cypionkella sp.]
MISVQDALARCLALTALTDTETLPLRRSNNRVMATVATAQLTQPPFDASAMDGYALGRAAAVGESFTVIGESGAGHAFHGAIAPHQAIRIFTGAPLPEGAVSVAIQEDILRDGDQIILKTTAKMADNIRPRGQDFVLGQALSPRLLRPNDLALLAAMNVPDVTVRRRPIVALMASGDELVMPGETPGPDQIIASNTFALAAMVEAAGGEARMLPIARDSEASLRTVFALTEGADLIVTIGGASVGDHDLVGKVATDLGLERAFWQIAMRPGKPLMAGKVLGIPMLGLPGNPVSAIVCGHLFMVPMLKAMLGLPPEPQVLSARLGHPQPANGPRDHYMRARLTIESGQPTVTAFARQDSALLTILTEANALLIRPKGDGPRGAGDMVNYIAI